ncbi:MAG TPA: DinB family protein [Roseiflexaceae bacterium]|nr:DinB family protein [Roseiflexaceae bacterium]
MPHPLVEQLRFTRAEFMRALVGVTEDEARRRFLPLNCISWNVGHLAWQEQRYFVTFAQGQVLLPDLNQRFAYGAPACTPSLAEMQTAWQDVTRTADVWLERVTTETLLQTHTVAQIGWTTSFGNLLQRVIYHYWYHTGENMAIRQNLGHSGLPDFVGDLDDEAPYRPS